MALELRDYQTDIATKGVIALNTYGLVYLAMQPRTGKTLTALTMAKYVFAQNVLFVTKKKAIKSIETDFEKSEYSYNLTVINYESLHKVVGSFDLIIIDEAHSCGAYANPNKRAKQLKKLAINKPIIYLSGTPTPESYSQIFHQLYISSYSPFRRYATFYKWAKEFVNVKQKNVGYGLVNNYDDANIDKIKQHTDMFWFDYTQQEAGFKSTIDEKIIEVELKESTYKLIDRLKKDLVIEGKNETILADTAVKLQSKLHQLYGGTIKFDSGKTMVLDNSKIEAILSRFKDTKIVIFYKFIAELESIKNVYLNQVTTDLEEFNSTNKSIALQIISGREGLNLSKAKYIVFYNIDFSANSYWQARDRLTTIDRKENNIFWVFAKKGIERAIYKAVMNKKSFTTSHFKKYLNE